MPPPNSPGDPPSPRNGRDAFKTGDFKAYRPLAWAELHDLFGVTRREAQVARYLAVGFTNAEIASALSISVHTVRRHVEHVLMRFGVHRRGEVAAKLLISRQ